jgi:hypothetical protein
VLPAETPQQAVEREIEERRTRMLERRAGTEPLAD